MNALTVAALLLEQAPRIPTMQTAAAGPAHKKYSDNFTFAGADQLAGQIRRYWAARGLSPHVWTEFVQIGEHLAPGTQGGVWCVKSDMIGGRPRDAEPS